MVWFYPTNCGFTNHSSENFQSHYGLILSKYDGLSAVKDFLLSIPLWSDFICCRSSLIIVSLYSFNPTMVWFYPEKYATLTSKNDSLSIPLWSDFIFVPEVLCVWSTTAFQSHYGLILSSQKLSHNNPFSLLSIPLWSDFIAKLNQRIDRIHRVFQSHYGLILSKLRLNQMLKHTTFNPTMVWFYPIIMT